MLNEFAVEPELFSSLAEYRYWSDQFGVDRARLIARYPRRWVQQAIKAIREESDIKRQSLIERIRRLEDHRKFVDLGRQPYDGTIPWLENALAQHAQEPFDGIVAKDNPAGAGPVLLAHEIDVDTPGFAVQPARMVPRTAEAMARCMRLMLREARELILVDAYFHPSESKFQRTLSAFAAEAFHGNALSAIHIHLRGDIRNAAPECDFRRACESSLPGLIPLGIDLHICRWQEVHQGDSFHARYVFTDLCGLSFDHGLDEESEHQTTDVHILSHEMHQKRRAQFSAGTTSYSLMDKTTITGTRQI